MENIQNFVKREKLGEYMMTKLRLCGIRKNIAPGE